MTEIVKWESLSPATLEVDCPQIEAWAVECESVPDLQEANNRLAGIDEYLARKERGSKDGRARVTATMRRIEVRIGQLLGVAPTPEESAARKGSRAREPSATNGLNATDRARLRRLAEHEDVVEAQIAQSTDDEPASRRKVDKAISEARDKAKPRHRPPAKIAGLEQSRRELRQLIAGLPPEDVAGWLGEDQERWTAARAEWDEVIDWLKALFRLRPRVDSVTVRLPDGTAVKISDRVDVVVEEAAKPKKTVLRVQHRQVASMWQWRMDPSVETAIRTRLNEVGATLLRSAIPGDVSVALRVAGWDPSHFDIKLTDWKED